MAHKDTPVWDRDWSKDKRKPKKFEIPIENSKEKEKRNKESSRRRSKRRRDNYYYDDEE